MLIFVIPDTGTQALSGFVEDHLSSVDPFAELFLFGGGQLEYRIAFIAAAAVVLRGTVFALDEQQVTAVVLAVGMCIAGFAALVAVADDIVCNAFAEALIKYKVLAFEFVGDALLAGFVGIFDDTAFEVIYVLKTVVEQVCRCFLAADTAGAVHHDVLVLLIFQHVYRHGQLFAEGIGRHFYGAVKMTYFIFVVIAHIHDNGIRIGADLIEGCCIEVLALAGHVETGIGNAVGHNLLFHLDT